MRTHIVYLHSALTCAHDLLLGTFVVLDACAWLVDFAAALSRDRDRWAAERNKLKTQIATQQEKAKQQATADRECRIYRIGAYPAADCC